MLTGTLPTHSVNAAPALPRTYPVGYYAIHPNVSLNFQMNRWYSWTGDEVMLAEMRAVAPEIHSYADVRRVFTRLAEQVLAQGHSLRGAYYLRMAEFFMFADDPAKEPTRQRLVRLLLEHYAVPASALHSIPYGAGQLKAFRFKPSDPKGTIVVHGGFDSYIEEFVPMLRQFQAAGNDVIAFEGPGQGAPLEEHHLPMTPEWERPLKVVLDYFAVSDATLIGISMGGYLALRAAAYEPRVRAAVAFDVFTDAWECALGTLSPRQRNALRLLVWLRAAPIVDAVCGRASRSSLVVEWGLKQAMHVFGVASPYLALRELAQCHTRDFSALLHQDVLILAGAEDHYVPLRLFFDQLPRLTHARSLTARLFTRAEQAQNHCQVGNFGLAVDTILSWVEARTKQ